MPGDTDSSNLRERTHQRGKLIDLQGHHAARQALDVLLETDEHDPRYERLLTEAISLGPTVLSAVVCRLDSSRPR